MIFARGVQDIFRWRVDTDKVELLIGDSGYARIQEGFNDTFDYDLHGFNSLFLNDEHS